MIFERIEIKNLFSYRQAVFDLDGLTKGTNIALISGRNGYGKTSFINAVKLLFAGPDKELRDAVQRSRTLTIKQYILGEGEDWLGILNRQARRAGETTCKVTIQWQEEDGIPVEASRAWEIRSNAYDESVEVYYGQDRRFLPDQQAQEFLNERLPEDYIPFFFYDGEQIQHLAEAVRSSVVRQTERLLNISRVEYLIKTLSDVVRDWSKEAMASEARQRLQQLEGKLGQLEAEIAVHREKLDDLEDERRGLEDEVREEEHRLARYRASGMQGDRLALEQEEQRIQEELSEDQVRLVEALAPKAPLLVNETLVRRVNELLEGLLDHADVRQISRLEEILDSLPEQLFAVPPPATVPPLLQEQIHYYRRRLRSLIAQHIPSPDTMDTGPLHIDPDRAKELKRLFDHYLQADQERRDRAADLRNLSGKKRRLAEVRHRLEDISHLAPEEQAEYRRRQAANNERHRRLGEIGSEVREHNKRVEGLEKQREEIQGKMNGQEKEVRLRERARLRVDRAQQAKDFFLSYKEELRRRKRTVLEEAVNHAFHELMTSHGMIDRIAVDEGFSIHFLDEDGEFIPMGSLSAGMKQLAATALLWGLKKVSGKSVPLVIDTPLARIDRDHQERLLTRYYPQAGEQVIILPTDSELDERKYALLRPHLYREYCLENPDGEDTRVIRAPMYPTLEPARG